MLIRPDVRVGSEADICGAKGHVCFTPESGHVRRTSPCLLWAKSGRKPLLLPCACPPVSSLSCHHRAQGQQRAYHEHSRCKIYWAEMCDPIKLEVPHVVIGQGHRETYDRRNHGSNPCPPFTTADPVPGQCADSNAGRGDKSRGGNV